MIKLDVKDRKLVASLVNNCRNSDSRIAKDIGVSREVVSYRIKNLEKEGVIKGYTAEIGFKSLGFLPYSLSIKLNNISAEAEKGILKSLIENKKMVFLKKKISKYDLVGTLLVKSLEELDKEIKEIRKIIGKNLKYLDLDAFVGDYDFFASLFGDKSKEIDFVENKREKIDEADEKILKELVENSRITAVELSKKTKLSVFSIADRIKNMIKKRIILSCRALIDMEKLGQHRYTILLNFFDNKAEDKLINFCRNHKLIWDVGKYIGNYNYAIEIYAENNEQFKKVVEEVMSEFSNSIIDYETLIILGELKHSYFFI